MPRKAFDKPPVEVEEPQERLHLRDVAGHRPLRNSGDLDRVHLYRIVRNDHAKVLNPRLLKLALVRPEVQLMLAETL